LLSPGRRLYHQVSAAQYSYVAWHMRRCRNLEGFDAARYQVLSDYLKELDKCTERNSLHGYIDFCPSPPVLAEHPDYGYFSAPMERFMWEELARHKKKNT